MKDEGWYSGCFLVERSDPKETRMTTSIKVKRNNYLYNNKHLDFHGQKKKYFRVTTLSKLKYSFRIVLKVASDNTIYKLCFKKSC